MQTKLFSGNEKTLTFKRPELVTKELKMGVTPAGGRRVRISTNFLTMMGFPSGARVIYSPDQHYGEGLSIRPTSDKGSAMIYQRGYTQRKNNPLESVIEISNQSLIKNCFPAYVERFHVSIRPGEVKLKPLANEVFAIRSRMMEAKEKYLAFVAMTSGIDGYCLQQTGFKVHSILEYRPQEKRDKRDLTETGALNALYNVQPKYIFNEDITKVNWPNVAGVITSDSPICLAHLSLQCDDYSLLKNSGAKAKSIESLDTTIDLVYDGLRMVETVKPAVVVVENVEQFGKSQAGQILSTKLRKWGYFVTEQVLDARNFKGYTARKRYYLVASVWPGYTMPSPTGSQPNEDLWSLVLKHLTDCRDVSETNNLNQGLITGRARLITQDKAFSPTVIKSQNRQAKDSIFIEHEGRYYFPSENLLKELNGIPQQCRLEVVSKDIACEIIGQSIEYPMHESLMQSIHTHIRANVERPMVTTITN